MLPIVKADGVAEQQRREKYSYKIYINCRVRAKCIERYECNKI